jgi:glycerol-3-phosphate dehydrogenase
VSAGRDDLFDVIIIGGGINGAGVARDAAMRGLSTLLVEKEDFGYGTSSRSSKLAHGGLRYLEHLEFGLVKESLRERATLERIAPHLVRPLSFLLPVYKGDRRPLWQVGLGVKLYAWLAGEPISRYRTVDAAEAVRLEPALEPRGLVGAALYRDDQIVSPERLCLENVLSAREAGAKAVNHVAVKAVRLRADGVTEVDVRNMITGAEETVAGRAVVNAAGPWGDHLRRMAGLDGRPTLRLTKGIHLVVPRVTRQALFISAKSDGRMFFVLPWKDWSLVGTTDTDFDGDLDALCATCDEVDYLLAETRRVLPGGRLTRDEVLYTYAGVRPLAATPPAPRGRLGRLAPRLQGAWGALRGGPGEGKQPGAVSRRHVVHVEGPRGTFLSVTGGKLTSYRALAEEVTDRIAAGLDRPRPARTAETPLYGGGLSSLERALSTDAPQLARRYGLAPATASTLVETYGSRAGEVLAPVARDPGLARRLCDRSPDILAQIKYAVDREYAVTLKDLLFRRLAAGTGPCQGRDCARRAAEVMGRYAGWDERRREREVAEYLAEADLARRYRAAPAGGAVARSARVEAR